MNKRYKDMLPEWYNEWWEFYQLVLSDDIDGLVSTNVLKNEQGWEIEYFYDFNKLYTTDKFYYVDENNRSATRVWADVSVVGSDEKAFDNHINRVNLKDYTNPNMINPNILTDITNENYYKKYCGSTALLVWSIYNIPLPKTELGKMILLCIDSTFKGFFGAGDFKERNKFYLCDVLGLKELYDVEKRHTKKEFYQLIDKYKLSKKIKLNKNGFIDTELDLEFLSDVLEIPIHIPEVQFKECNSFKNIGEIDFYKKSITEINNVKTLAFTGKNKCRYSTIIL